MLGKSSKFGIELPWYLLKEFSRKGQKKYICDVTTQSNLLALLREASHREYDCLT